MSDRAPHPGEGAWAGFFGMLVVLVAGGIAGGLLGLLAGLPLAQALGISDFEGARGYFVAFVMLPAGALFGAGTGLVLYLAARRRRSRGPGSPSPRSGSTDRG